MSGLMRKVAVRDVAFFFALSLGFSKICSACGDLGDILAPQACAPVFVGVESKHVVNHLGSILPGNWKGRPFTELRMGMCFSMSLIFCDSGVS